MSTIKGDNNNNLNEQTSINELSENKSTAIEEESNHSSTSNEDTSNDSDDEFSEFKKTIPQDLQKKIHEIAVKSAGPKKERVTDRKILEKREKMYNYDPSLKKKRKTREVGLIRGSKADYSSLKLTKLFPRKTMETVMDLLYGMKPEYASNGNGYGDCVKEAIRKGYLDVAGTPEDLKKVVFKGLSLNYCMDLECECPIDVTLEQLLTQTNYPGTDYEDGLESAKIFCKEHLDGEISGANVTPPITVWNQFF